MGRNWPHAEVRRGGLVQEMIKGSNVALADLSDDVGSVIVSLGWSSPTGEGDADVSVLLLDANGKVRSDGDFYFYNHPVAVDGSVQLLGKTPTVDGSEDRISFDLTAVPSEIDRIIVAASRYDGARFSELQDVRITLADAAGESLLQFAVDDAGSVTAVIFGELYRRGEEWKFRAVGQGYAIGLAGLAADFGVDIEDDAAAEAEGSLEGTDGEEQTDAAGPAPAEGPEPQAALEAIPAPRRPESEAVGLKAPSSRPRTSKKKVTLPKTVRKTLAENDTWKRARLFPVSVLKSDRDRETRAPPRCCWR